MDVLSLLRESMTRVSAEAANLAKAGAQAAVGKTKEVKKKSSAKKADKKVGSPKEGVRGKGVRGKVSEGRSLKEGKGLKRKADPLGDQCEDSPKELKKTEGTSPKKQEKKAEESKEDKEADKDKSKKPKKEKRGKKDKNAKELALEAGPAPRWELGKASGGWGGQAGMKVAQVRAHQGHYFLDIREHYTDPLTWEAKPGKKGVTLGRAEFDQLRLVMEEVDRLVEPPEGDLLA